MSGLDKLHDIRLVAFDVDGVFTDGRFYLSDDGVETKAFNTQDGYGIRQLLSAGIAVAVISGRKSALSRGAWRNSAFHTSCRAARTRSQPWTNIAGALGITARECAYVGDDIPDLPLLKHVGISIAVANAVAACATTATMRHRRRAASARSARSVNSDVAAKAMDLMSPRTSRTCSRPDRRVRLAAGTWLAPIDLAITTNASRTGQPRLLPQVRAHPRHWRNRQPVV